MAIDFVRREDASRSGRRPAIPARFGRPLRLVVAGALFGAVLIGAGGRLVMRVLAALNGIAPVFSFGGSMEVVLYGAIVGAVGGVAVAVMSTPLRRWPSVGGLALGAIVYAGTVATLPGHIAGTAAPFMNMMAAVWSLFGLCFLAWGLAMGRMAAKA